uniref:Uncharacterized protein n=1 Tax=Aegilops tauschii subsp. strangulata TaxID=200361 RepID=A0A453K5V5_AEGTS
MDVATTRLSSHPCLRRRRHPGSHPRRLLPPLRPPRHAAAAAATTSSVIDQFSLGPIPQCECLTGRCGASRCIPSPSVMSSVPACALSLQDPISVLSAAW